MDRVFDQVEIQPNPKQNLVPVDVDIHEPAADPQPQETAAPDKGNTPPWLLPTLGGIALAGVVSSGWLINNLQTSRHQLEQERNLALIERLREQASAKQEDSATEQTPVAEHLPPPPEPGWVQSLEPLTLPIRPAPLAASAPAVSEAAPPAAASLPQLTGVVQGPGASSSAIFQIGQASFTAGIGEGIGSSGWILKSVSDTGAVIGRDDETRSLSVGGIF